MCVCVCVCARMCLHARMCVNVCMHLYVSVRNTLRERERERESERESLIQTRSIWYNVTEDGAKEVENNADFADQTGLKVNTIFQTLGFWIHV